MMSTSPTARVAAFPLALISLAVLGGCAGPAYPSCITDDTCRATGEYCVDRNCAQCRVSANCPGGACATCAHGACGWLTDCCTTNNDCKSGKKCASGRCDVACHVDKECPVGQRCDPNGACLASALVNGGKSDGCTHDEDCGSDLNCTNGMCVDAERNCQLVPVRFETDQYALTAEQEDLVVADFKCMKRTKARTIVVEGHDDSSADFGLRRAAAVKTFLHKLDPKLRVKVATTGQ